MKSQVLPPEALTEIIGKPAMSQAELKKLAELKRLKREAKKKKKMGETPGAENDVFPVKKSFDLPPVQMQRRGQFDMVPDFLKQNMQNEAKQAMVEIEDRDMMSEALQRQDEANRDRYEGMSMAEIA